MPPNDPAHRGRPPGKRCYTEGQDAAGIRCSVWLGDRLPAPLIRRLAGELDRNLHSAKDTVVQEQFDIAAENQTPIITQEMNKKRER
jgi:hypothetical protein